MSITFSEDDDFIEIDCIELQTSVHFSSSFPLNDLWYDEKKKKLETRLISFEEENNKESQKENLRR